MKIYSVLTAILIALFFIGCSEEDTVTVSGGELTLYSEGGTTYGSTSRISGIATDDPISNGSVVIRDLNGEEIQRTTTDVNGRFSLDVDSSRILNGYLLSVSGGKIGSDDFIGELKAAYAGSHNKNNANITLITTLIEKIAEDETGTALQKRDLAIKKLVNIGMIQNADWFEENPENLELLLLQNYVRLNGLNVWLDNMKNDLIDKQLTQDKMRFFPKAHAGVSRVLISPTDIISIFPGQTKTISANAEFINEDEQNISIVKIDGPNWVATEDENLIFSPEDNLTSYGDFTITIEILANGLKTGRFETVVVSLLQKVVLLSGELGVSGGKIENLWKDISISVDANKLSQTYDIEYNAGLTQDGRVIEWFDSTPKMNFTDSLWLRVSQPDTDILKANYLENIVLNRNLRSVQNLGFASLSVPTECVPLKIANSKNNEMVWTDENEDNLTLSYVWQGKVASFNTNHYVWLMNKRGGLPRLSSDGFVTVGEDTPIKQCASALRSEISDSENIEGNNSVLFVHGFINSGLLGGYDQGAGILGGEYFAKFPKIVKDAGYIPFVFQWRTNARFQDVADELGRAVKKIAEKTGKKVHIVAHSFGGLLTRTLVQGLSSSVAYRGNFSEKYISSVSTVGTPHSGTFGTKDNKVEFDNEGEVIFPEGRHGETLDLATFDLSSAAVGAGIEQCQAITCYQTGSGSELTSNVLNDKTSGVGSPILYGTRSEVGYTPYSLYKRLEFYPSVPTQVLIGLVPESIKGEIQADVTYNLSYDFFNEQATTNPASGDYLISIFGQRVEPDSDQSDLNSMYISNNIVEHILPMDGRSREFSEGVDDWIVDKYTLIGNNDWTIEDYRTHVDLDDLISFADGYNHRTGQYAADSTSFGTRKIYRQSEVGLQNCKDSEDCNNSTWNYFKFFVNKHKAESIDFPEESYIYVSGKVLQDNAIPETPYRIKIYANDEILEEKYLVDVMDYNISVKFIPLADYQVKIFFDNYEFRANPSNIKITDLTVEESDLSFNDIFINKEYSESKISVVLTDAIDNSELSDFNISIYSGENNLIDSGHTNDAIYSTILGNNNYTCVASKVGYRDSSHIPCNSIKDENSSYNIKIYRDEAVGTARRIVVFADDIQPWDTNAFTDTMTANGYTPGINNGQYSVISSNQMASAEIIPGKDLVIIMNDQTQTFYNALADSMEKINSFVLNGGVILFEASDRGWNDGSMDAAGITELPGGVTFGYNYDNTNINVNPNSTLMTGLGSVLEGNYASHESFDNLPVGTTIYTTDTNGKATLVEYKHGLGWVILTGQPLEHGYENGLTIGTIYPKLYNYVLGNISDDLRSRSVKRIVRSNENIIPSHK